MTLVQGRVISRVEFLTRVLARLRRHIIILSVIGSSMWSLCSCGDNIELDSGLETRELAEQTWSDAQSSTIVVGPAHSRGYETTPQELEARELAEQTWSEAQSSTIVVGPAHSRGYQTTPQELVEIQRKAGEGIEPYATAVTWTIEAADVEWEFELHTQETCPDAHSPAWNDNGAGTQILYAKALAFHLTGQETYAEEVKNILQRIMSEVEIIDPDDEQCPLNFAWGTPELVATADLLEAYWQDQECTGPLSPLPGDTRSGSGNCKSLFQNWLVKNPYYIISRTAEASTSNWGAAATNATAHVADYLWDRSDVMLIHRNPQQVNGGAEEALTPAEAYARANKVAIDRMNGYRVGYGSIKTCDRFKLNWEQNSEWEPVKSQISENGIVPDDARRKEYCNIARYDAQYKHNYPQLHLGNNIQQCELMLRRGDRSCYDNIDNTDIPEYTFIDPFGLENSTHLHAGRGSIEKAINAIIVDAGISWQHDPALEVAYRYYFSNHTMPGVEKWADQLGRRRARCLNHLCFGLLTHGFASDEIPQDPPVVPAPGAVYTDS